MQKWISILASAAVVALAVLLALPGLTQLPVPAPRADGGSVGDAGAPTALTDAAATPDGASGSPATADGGLDEPLGREAAPSIAGDETRLALPSKTPKTVRCGVILITFAGAQGAAPSARSHADAKALAEKLAADARTDFRGAVARGDSGSAEDIGRIPRGVLESPLEYALFTLPAGGVSDPVESPRGFWIAKRLE